MIGQRTGMLAQTNHHHFQKTAFNGSVKAGVRLDSGDDADVIRLGRLPINHDGKAFGSRSHTHDLH